MADIILISPPFPNQAAQQGFELTRPMGLFCLAATLKQAGYDVAVQHFEKHNQGIDKIEPFLRMNKAGVYGVTATTATRFGAIAVIKEIKKLYPQSIIVTGGAHFQNCLDDSLINIPEIDLIVRDEADYTIVNLMRALESREDLSSVKGISYKRDGAIIHTPNAAAIADLDSLPVYTDFDYNDYRETVFVIEQKVPAISILSSRGCPHRCIFCSVSNSGYRFRSPENVVDEIELWLNKFPVLKGFNFFDLTFTANMQHAKAVCDEIIKRSLKVTWWAESRVNIDFALLKIMRKAGCLALSVGVESGSEKVLKRISKSITIPEVRQFVRNCKNAGIEPLLFFMASFPQETIHDLQLSKELIKEMLRDTTAITLSVASVYPGTQLEAIARKSNLLEPSFSWAKPYYSELSQRLTPYPDIPVYLDELRADELENFQLEVRALRFGTKFDAHPLKYFANAIKLVCQPGKSFLYKLRLGLRFFILYTVKKLPILEKCLKP